MLANIWQKNWQYIQDSIKSQVDAEIKITYVKLNHKFEKLKDTQKVVPKKKTTFYPGVVNNTNITFSDDESNILHKRLKYNICFKTKNWITTLALEAEAAICSLPMQDQDYFRGQVAKTINYLFRHERNNHYNNNRRAFIENRTIMNTGTKLEENNAIITEADKVNCIIIMFRNDYTDRLDNFI
jgi:hypothetical protein